MFRNRGILILIFRTSKEAYFYFHKTNLKIPYKHVPYLTEKRRFHHFKIKTPLSLMFAEEYRKSSKLSYVFRKLNIKIINILKYYKTL